MVIVSVVLSLFIFYSCKQSDKQASTEAYADLENAPAGLAEEKIAISGRRSAPEREKRNDDEGYQVRFSKVEEKYERLIEYRVNLSFESKDFKKSRANLYKMASEYGFIKTSSDNFKERQTISASLWVESNRLYDFLQIAGQLGVLQSENINSDDLTFKMYSQQVTLRRENIRIIRRSRALTGSSSSKNFTDRERVLAESEDKEDAALKEKWQVEDRVKWAKVSIYIADPRPELGITVPNYVEVLYDLGNIFLLILYGLLYISPFVGLALLAWFKRNRITGFFRQGK